MDQIKISLPEVSASAGAIRSYNKQLDETLSTVYKTMNELNSSWMSEGSEMIQSRFARFATRFLKENEAIESYAAFLDYTVSSYETLESTITSNASTFE